MMRHYNIFAILAGMASLVLAPACTPDDNPSIDDFELNYEITEVKANQDIPVGCMLVNPYGDLSNASIWERLTQEYDATVGHIGPNLMPTLGQYRLMGTAEDLQDEIAQNLGQIVEWSKKAGIDYLITPPVRESNQYKPNCINAEDSLFLNLISGRNKDLAWHNDGSMKYAIMVNIQNIAANIGCNSNTMLLENKNDITYTLTEKDEEGNVISEEKVTIPQRERLMNYMAQIAKYLKDDTYYQYQGRPVILFREPHLLHTVDVAKLYADMRATMQEVCGKNPYIIAIQEPWKPIARYSLVVLDGQPDAVVPRQMTNVSDGIYERIYYYNVFLNENFKLNRQFLEQSYPGIEYIPSVSAAFNYYVTDGRYTYPNINYSEQGFRERCWVAKMNLPSNPMVIIDAFNDWRYANAIEPTDPNYGKGYGEKYLDIVRQEFKVSK